jgi:hypothetical protein
MKINVKTAFSYSLDSVTSHRLERGIHDVSKEVADIALSFRYASRVEFAKVAPENKVISAPENKSEAEISPSKRLKKAK